MLHENRRVEVTKSASRIRFERKGPSMNPSFDRYLLIDEERAFHVGNVCDTCAFLFERLGGATTRVSAAEIGDALRRGIASLQDEAVGHAGAAMPAGIYETLLLDLEPELVRPGDPEDYFAHEQVDLWGLDPFWDLPHHPRTEYYRSRSIRLGAGRQLFEFVIPIIPSSWLDAGTVGRYIDRGGCGDHPTALAISHLDVKQPAHWKGDPEITEHWCLAHYLLDGHHKTLAASRSGRPLRLLSFLATGESIATSEEIAELLGRLAG